MFTSLLFSTVCKVKPTAAHVYMVGEVAQLTAKCGKYRDDAADEP